MTSKRWAVWLAFLAAYTTFTAGSGLADVVSSKVAGLMALVAAALQAGSSAFMAASKNETGDSNNGTRQSV